MSFFCPFRVCFQISEGSSFGVREFLEDFLSKWRSVDERYYVLVDAEANVDCIPRHDRRFILGVDEYFEVVEVYAVTILATVLNDFEFAISLVEKAALPEERRQVFYIVIDLSWSTLYWNELCWFLDLA